MHRSILLIVAHTCLASVVAIGLALTYLSSREPTIDPDWVSTLLENPSKGKASAWQRDAEGRIILVIRIGKMFNSNQDTILRTDNQDTILRTDEGIMFGGEFISSMAEGDRVVLIDKYRDVIVDKELPGSLLTNNRDDMRVVKPFRVDDIVRRLFPEVVSYSPPAFLGSTGLCR